MLGLNDIDTSRLLYDPKDKNFVNILEGKIPSFAEYQGKLNKKKVFMYLVLIYDINSPLRKEIPDFYERKRQASIMVGITPDKKGKFSVDVESMIFSEDKHIATMLADLIASYSNPDWTEYVMYLGLREKMLIDVLFSKETKTTIHKDISATSAHLKELERNLFGSGEYDELQEAKKALYARAERDRTGRLRPEVVASNLDEAGENPYGDSYKVGEMEFLGDDEKVVKKVVNGTKEG